MIDNSVTAAKKIYPGWRSRIRRLIRPCLLGIFIIYGIDCRLTQAIQPELGQGVQSFPYKDDQMMADFLTAYSAVLTDVSQVQYLPDTGIGL